MGRKIINISKMNEINEKVDLKINKLLDKSKQQAIKDWIDSNS